MFERLRILIDVVTDKATAGINGFRASVASADGVAGKLKAGVSSLGSTFMSFIKSPQGAAVAVGAAAVAMAKAITAASDLALEVAKLADATGLSTEAASRWVEVGKDMGMSGEQIAGLISKMTVALGKTPEKFAAAGIEIQKTADGTADMNATLLTAIDVLNRTTDPTKRAALAQQLFGKSWKDASELISAGSASVAKRLAEVSDTKIIDKKEIEQARKFRDTLDGLKDAGEDLVITVGQALIPVLNEVVPVITDIAEAVGDVVGAVDAVADAVDFMPSVADEFDWEKIEQTRKELELTKSIIEDTTPAVVEFGDASKEAARDAYELGVEQQVLADKSAAVARAVRDEELAVRMLQGAISNEEASLAFQSAMAAMNEEIARTGTVSDETRLRVEAMALGLTNVSAARAGQFKIALDNGDLERAFELQNQIIALAAIPVKMHVTIDGQIADSTLRNILEGRGAR